MYNKIITSIFVCFFWSVFTTNAQDIIISGIPTATFCGGDTFRVSYNYQAAQSLTSSNKFTVVLSDTNGNFTSGTTTLATSNSTQNPLGNLFITIPYRYYKYELYRIKVISSSPVAESLPSNYITINESVFPRNSKSIVSQCAKKNLFNFINTSTGTEPITYLWEFGDGDTSTKKTPQKTYNNAGNYTVYFTTISKYGCRWKNMDNATVHPDPEVSIIINDSLQCYTNNSFVFTPKVLFVPSGSVSYSWLIGNNTSSTLSPKLSFGIGTYSARLIVTSSLGFCKDTAYSEVRVFDSPPKPTITGPTACIGQQTANYSVSGSSINIYNWAVSGGTIQSGQGSQQITVKWLENNGITGRVSVIEVSPYGCSSPAFMLPVNLSSSGVWETKNPFGISVYPNPSSGVVSINTGNYNGEYSIRVYNQLGQLVFAEGKVIGEKSINLKELNEGIYFIKIKGEGFDFSEKIIRYGNE